MGCGSGRDCKCCGITVYNYEYHGCDEKTIADCKNCGKRHCKNCDHGCGK